MNLCTLPVARRPGVDRRVPLERRPAERAPEVVVGLRPEALVLGADGVAARVEVVEELGADAYAFCTAALPGGEARLVARADARRPPGRGEPVHLRPCAEHEPHLFDVGTGERIGT